MLMGPTNYWFHIHWRNCHVGSDITPVLLYPLFIYIHLLSPFERSPPLATPFNIYFYLIQIIERKRGRRKPTQMENVMGLLRVRVEKGINLASRDASGSDAYVVVRMGDQKLKSSVKKNSQNPVWNDDLTLCISDPILPLKIEVFDKDTFTPDDKLGDAELDIEPLIQAVKMNLVGVPNGIIITTVKPSRQNCLADESHISLKDGSVAQDVILRLRNVESGEVELKLLWVNVPRNQAI
ncbi:hypothetical protein Cni_G19180 [Canna indica]|uniref:C2 domain-containing protein n=1 Tax=Canna indica TaxID=4628 RepID=A0AAQ3QJH6_9LILI|nr:hypothetical protein Cni_G19180 [Canna indica]